MVDVAQYINEVKRDSERLVVIQKVKVWYKKKFNWYQLFTKMNFQTAVRSIDSSFVFMLIILTHKPQIWCSMDFGVAISKFPMTGTGEEKII